MTDPVHCCRGEVRLRVQVQPRAAREELAGVHGDALKVRVTAPPTEGAANRALVRLLAERLALPTRGVELVSGLGSRRKMLRIRGLDAATVRSRLGLSPPPTPD